MAWEEKVIEFMKNFTSPNMTVSFSTERSIQDELDRESRSDVYTILISYMAMFLYITLTLGNFRMFSSSSNSVSSSSNGPSDESRTPPQQRYDTRRVREIFI